MSLNNYYVKRVAQAFVTLFATITASFFLIQLMPGGPMDYLRSQMVTQRGVAEGDLERIDRLAELYLNVNPEEPLLNQYIDYMTSAAQGDFGVSIWFQVPVMDLLGPALPWTFWLFSTAMIINFFIGIVVGALMAWYEASRFDVSSSILATLATSVPYYVIAILLLYFLGFGSDLLPTSGRHPRGTTPGFNLEFMWGIFLHGLLPLLSLTLVGWAGTTLAMRGNSIRVLGDDYLRVAELRGISNSRIAIRYVMRNAILPLYTGLMIGIAGIFGGSVILEAIFGYRAMGYYLYFAVLTRDFPVMMGSLILFTVITVVAILIADLTYVKIDPRAGGEKREAF